MATYRLTLEYDGTRYHGWQEQQNARTVAGELRRAAERTGGRVLDLGGSGRTDTGVHALAQVAHLRLSRAIDPDRFLARLNGVLPGDIHVLDASPAPRTFHARHDARSRSYLYQISRRRTAFGKRYVWWIKRPLDVGRIAAAAALLAGRHDFAHFCERPQEQSSTVVVVEEARVAESGDLVLVRLAASHFLWRMVRRLVGTLVKIGAGELEAARLARLLEGSPREAAGDGPAQWTAPASGLFLERVRYAGDPPLGALAPAVAIHSRSGGIR
jgi:tRNA pseudouridine38-40 synthase